MEQPSRSVRAIFDHAVEIEAAEQREAYLDEACAGKAGLREKVAGLLRAYEAAASFLESPAPNLIATVDDPAISERPGTIIGPSQLLEQIGEGGFGVVFMAEQ